MTVAELVLKLRKFDSRSQVEMVIVRGDERFYTEVASVSMNKNYLGRVTVEITNEG